ncbi:MAG: hypothetical protein QW247_01135 [Pyrobaculum sp.]
MKYRITAGISVKTYTLSAPLFTARNSHMQIPGKAGPEVTTGA